MLHNFYAVYYYRIIYSLCYYISFMQSRLPLRPGYDITLGIGQKECPPQQKCSGAYHQFAVRLVKPMFTSTYLAAANVRQMGTY